MTQVFTRHRYEGRRHYSRPGNYPLLRWQPVKAGKVVIMRKTADSKKQIWGVITENLM